MRVEREDRESADRGGRMINIRPAVVEDHELIVSFQLKMAQETEDVALDSETLSAGVWAALLDPVKGEYLVAEFNDERVGCLLTVREWSDWRNGEVIWIHSLYVVPEARRKGVFKQLYLYLKHQVDEDPELRGLRLYVHRDNTLAQSAYASLGMDGDHYRMFEWMPSG
ncbi:MAG: GNAT family N-acetyltransferase [Gemmatimonadetes bacterium]|nr:GNAT family N-acetyltransferase [Gemmatimonadota bacterium]